MRTTIYTLLLSIAATQFAAASVFAQELALAPASRDCPSEEPDSLQVSWNRPCEEGDWLLDTETGCRMWDWHPDTQDRAVWSGACPAGRKDGRGTVQWFEHGQAIDRFEGAYRDGKREGFGRYVWNDSTSFEGQYVNDLPDGFGTATVVGETFSGNWVKGCIARADRVVAIGVDRKTCMDLTAQAREPGKAAF